MYCLKNKKLGEREQVQSALFPGHTLLVRSIIITVYNSKCISGNSK